MSWKIFNRGEETNLTTRTKKDAKKEIRKAVTDSKKDNNLEPQRSSDYKIVKTK